MENERLIENLLKQGPGQELTFLVSDRKSEIAIILCSFLNGDGGVLVIGLAENGKIKGVANAEQWKEDLNIFLLSALVPEAPISITVEKYGNANLLVLRVYGGSRQPYLFDGSIYYCKGASTVKATSQQISELIHGRQKAEQHWERQSALGIDLDDLDSNLVGGLRKESQNNHRSNYGVASMKEFLAHYGLYQNGSFTNACLVLFGKNQWKRVDFKFPEKALQEGVVNALIHRDYSSPSSGVSISVFPDHIVISNSGHLPDGLKPRELKKSHRSHPVNPGIAQIVFLRGLIDKLGKGTVKVVELCRESGLKDPEWKDSSDGVSLTFFGPKALAAMKTDAVTDAVSDALNDTVRLIASQKDRVFIVQVMEATQKSNATAKRYLQLFKLLGLVEFKGSPKSGKYCLTEKMKAKVKGN